MNRLETGTVEPEDAALQISTLKRLETRKQCAEQHRKTKLESLFCISLTLSLNFHKNLN